MASSRLMLALLVSLSLVLAIEATVPKPKDKVVVLPPPPPRPPVKWWKARIPLPTWQACVKHCPRCLLPGDPSGTNICYGYFPHWYFSFSQQTCVRFIYGGCGGNANRFLSEQECLKTCQKFIYPSIG